MSNTTETTTLIDRLFKAGSHFGFKKRRRHPTVAPYLFTTKDGSDIFDLEKTTKLIDAAKEVLKEAGLQGKTILMVSTKDESSKIVKDIAEKIGVSYVSNRWIGGMLTNFSEIKKRINRLEALSHEQESGELERKYTKKERVVLGREAEKLGFNFKGISGMQKMPDLLVIVDPRHDSIAVKEAHEKNIPIIAIMSSDCNLSEVKYPVVANDSLQSSVSLVLGELISAFEEGRSAYTPKVVEGRPRTSSPRRPA
jgi:small subunit ribosomal protein S2